jgi:hypothetical protein
MCTNEYKGIRLVKHETHLNCILKFSSYLKEKHCNSSNLFMEKIYIYSQSQSKLLYAHCGLNANFLYVIAGDTNSNHSML